LNVAELVESLRYKDVRLQAVEDKLRVDAPANVDYEALRYTLSKNKAALLRYLRQEQQELEEAYKRGLIIQWSKHPGWISLHDPTTGEWHDVVPSECLPGIVEAAKSHGQRLKGAVNHEFRDGQV
jgi:predicted metal-dependent hydrolase